LLKRFYDMSFRIILSIVCVSVSFAQVPMQAGANFTLGFPQNEFRKNVDNVTLGGSGYFLCRILSTAFSVGGGLGFLVYGQDTREEVFSQTIPDVYVDVTTTNSILMGHLLLRIQPVQGPVCPYIDGLFGFSYLSTRTSIKDQDDWDDEDEIASTTNYEDFASRYGFGGGFMIGVYRVPEEKSEVESLESVCIDLGVQYMHGGEAEYLMEGSIEIEDSNIIYDVRKSTTDLITVHIGVAFNFHAP
jgi:hypothetical protein